MSETVFEKAHREANRNMTIGRPSELLEDNLEHSTHIKLCPFCGSAGVAYKSERANVLLAKCINAECYLNDVEYFPLEQWNQRQPHPDSTLLEFTFKHKIAYAQHPKGNWSLILDGETIYGGGSPREALQQAMEQEK